MLPGLPGIHAGNRAAALRLGYAGFCVAYLLAGHVHWRPPTEPVLSPLDRLTPFVPWTIWLYLSQFPFTFVALWTGGADHARSRAFYAMVVATLLAVPVFLLWPTTGPRPGAGLGGVTGGVYRLLYGLDAPTNLFPSLHVALAALGAARFAADGRGAGGLAAVWAGVIILSTLTTRQHVALDVVGGLGVAALAHRIVRRWPIGA